MSVKLGLSLYCLPIPPSPLNPSGEESIEGRGHPGTELGWFTFILVTTSLEGKRVYSRWVSSLPLSQPICTWCWSISHIWLAVIPWTVSRQIPLSLEFFRQEYWSGLPFPSPGNLDPGIETRSPTLQADSLPSEPPGKPCTLGPTGA